MVNLTTCARLFAEGVVAKNVTILSYMYNGTLARIDRDPTSQITYRGCRELCGTAPDYYTFSDASSAITTWILPIMGVLSQGPYESNKTWATVLVIIRWVGSPIVSLSYILWNIRVLGNAALMVDMSVKMDEPPMDEELTKPEDEIDWTRVSATSKEYYDMRDSLYILSVMNQYTINRIRPKDLKTELYTAKAAEGLLRIVLFSKDLQLPGAQCPKHPTSLAEARRLLAYELRRTRKRAVVPVIVSTIWFVFALGISVYAAFNEIGENAVAHDLALGLLLAWLPVLIICSIVDRNPTDPDGNLKALNDLVLSVSLSFEDNTIFEKYCNTVKANYDYHEIGVTSDVLDRELRKIRNLCIFLANESRRAMPVSSAPIPVQPASGNITPSLLIQLQEMWIKSMDCLSNLKPSSIKHRLVYLFGPTQRPARVTFFGNFAGQGRERWHYGAAHPVLSEIEHAYVGSETRDANGLRFIAGKRDWLEDPAQARVNLVLGKIADRKGLIWWDNRETWQVCAAVIIVCSSCFAAFTLSYNTPTVGLGCRSGSYMIFVLLSVFLLLLELLAWRVNWRSLRNTLHRRWISGAVSPAPSTPTSTVGPDQSENVRTYEPIPTLHVETSPAQLSPISSEVDVNALSPQGSPEAGPETVPGSLSASTSQQTTAAPSIEGSGPNSVPVQQNIPDWHDVTQQTIANGGYEWFDPFRHRTYLKNLVLIPLETINACWLAYTVFAQTSGGFRSCECITSSYELGEEGYLDFKQNDVTNTKSLKFYWIPSTVLGVVVLGMGLLYVISEVRVKTSKTVRRTD
ncbi:hypothetical protein CAC42_1685 [Sphaceloma murrayae]|uniref:Uncharacterized protein n=1 Tax=Sphaceloma murrayae TaxID=2082308 RepID=A0A2K1QIJ2_9PEZI|nr:hypothetical protein CAC42_1685 [Sphaceloma murrayae]